MGVEPGRELWFGGGVDDLEGDATVRGLLERLEHEYDLVLDVRELRWHVLARGDVVREQDVCVESRQALARRACDDGDLLCAQLDPCISEARDAGEVAHAEGEEDPRECRHGDRTAGPGGHARLLSTMTAFRPPK